MTPIPYLVKPREIYEITDSDGYVIGIIYRQDVAEYIRQLVEADAKRLIAEGKE